VAAFLHDYSSVQHKRTVAVRRDDAATSPTCQWCVQSSPLGANPRRCITLKHKRKVTWHPNMTGFQAAT